jgi:hypothetical protein
MHNQSPNKPRKFKKMFSACQKADGIFLLKKDVLVVEFMQQQTTITSEVYCETLN